MSCYAYVFITKAFDFAYADIERQYLDIVKKMQDGAVGIETVNAFALIGPRENELQTTIRNLEKDILDTQSSFLEKAGNSVQYVLGKFYMKKHIPYHSSAYYLVKEVR